MDRGLIEAFSAITRASELLEKDPKALRECNIEQIEKKIELCQKKIISSQQAYQQVIAMYSNQFGKPQVSKVGENEIALRNAEIDFNDAALRSLLFAPQKGLFAKRPKEADYRRFCQSAMIVFAHYTKELSQLEAYCEAFRFSQPEQLKRLSGGLIRAKENINPSPDNWRKYPSPANCSKELYLGNIEIPVETMGLEGLREIGFLEVQDNESWVEFPFSYNAREPFSLFISYEGDTKEGEIRMGNLTRSLMYQIIHALPPYSYQFIYLDPFRGGTSLQEINSKLASAIDGNAFRLHEELYPDHQYKLLTVGSNRDEMQQLLRSLEQRIAKINSICGGQTVMEYNAPLFNPDGSIKDGGNGVIPQMFVFVENVHGYLTQDMVQLLHKLADCAKVSGISLIVTSLREKGENFTKEEHELLLQDKYRDDLDHIRWEQDGCSVYFDGSLLGQESGRYLFYNFAPCWENLCQEDYLSKVSSGLRPSLDTETRYEKRVDIDALFGTGNADMQIVIPVGVNSRNQIATVALGGPDGAHGLLAGSTGCGKSSFLHAIINGVIVHYKPTDVQIWLSDYKTAEFRRYMNNTPPHITYVGVGRSVEYSMNFLDRIWNEYERRLLAFGTATSVAEYREIHGIDSMPRIFIVVDEFHVMSNHVKEFPEYKMKLAALLREARAMGITFLLSDQTCGVGLQGLSEDGKLQLTCRMSMMTTNEEYNAVFNIPNAREVIPTQQKFEVVLARQTSRMNSKGVIENIKFYEHCKTLFIEPKVRDAIAQKSNEIYGPAKDPLFVEDSIRSIADWKIISEEEAKAPSQRGFPVYMGTPLSLKKFFAFRILPNYSENVISVVPFDDVQASVFISELESIRRQGNYEIYIIADINDSLYGFCEGWINQQTRQDSKIHVIEDIDSTCATVWQLWNTMVERRRQRNYESRIYVFWMGLYDISREMSYLGNNKPVGDYRRPTMNRVLIDEVADLERQFDALFGQIESLATKPQNVAEEVTTSAYNATDDIRELLDEGPKREIHNFVFTSAVTIAKKTKCAPLDSFVHKVAMAIGKDDALELFGTGRLMTNAEGKQLDNNTAVYYNGRTSAPFMPFISDLEDGSFEQTGL